MFIRLADRQPVYLRWAIGNYIGKATVVSSVQAAPSARLPEPGSTILMILMVRMGILQQYKTQQSDEQTGSQTADRSWVHWQGAVFMRETLPHDFQYGARRTLTMQEVVPHSHRRPKPSSEVAA
jgi:hypothetical protein